MRRRRMLSAPSGRRGKTMKRIMAVESPTRTDTLSGTIVPNSAKTLRGSEVAAPGTDSRKLGGRWASSPKTPRICRPYRPCGMVFAYGWPSFEQSEIIGVRRAFAGTRVPFQSIGVHRCQ